MKKRLFIDTNVMLDFLGERKLFYEPISKIASLAESEKVTLIVSPISFATVNYFLSKHEGNEAAKLKLRKFKILAEVCSIDEHTIEKGLNSEFKDFEDALQYFNATEANCDFIITRNEKDFKNALIPVLNPTEYLASL